jgi:predicted nucleic acid-binding protein
MPYCLDANVFIEAHRRYYAFDIAPGFWEALSEWAAQGAICSPLLVYDEIARSKDQLAEWAKAHKESLFADPDESTVTAYREIADMVANLYEPQHVQGFLMGADPWVIAHAKAHNLVLVTMESLRAEQLSKKSGLIAGGIKIPNICKRVGIKFINTFDLMRELRLTLR